MVQSVTRAMNLMVLLEQPFGSCERGDKYEEQKIRPCE